jgi:hypothetical protein
LFKPLEGNKSQQRKWASMRRNVYEGSLLHFMRMLNQDKLKEAGFTIRRLIRNPNREKERVKSILDSTTDISVITDDSIKYYKQVMKMNDYTDLLYPEPLDFAKFATRVDSSTVLMNFKDCLQISYLNKKEDPEYYLKSVGVYPDSCITAILTLWKHNPISVSSSGSFYDVTDLTLMGYWAWSEKIAKMLPFDYWP